jgi:hypothetical protein
MDDRTGIANTVSDETALRGLYQQPMELAVLKQPSNIVSDAEVGLLFFIPGIDETLRINGTARLSREPELLTAAAINGRAPRLIILVTVREAFLHCGKALKRSRLWQDDYRVDKKSFPSVGRMIVEQTKPAAVTVEQADAFVEENYVTGLY